MPTKREILRDLAIRAGHVRVDVPSVKVALANRGHEVAYSTVNAWFSGGRSPTSKSQAALAEALGATEEETLALFRAASG